MKRFLLIIDACFPDIGLLAADVEPMPADTVIRLENKRIVVKDNGERMKVKVYELTEEGDSIDREMIFEERRLPVEYVIFVFVVLLQSAQDLFHIIDHQNTWLLGGEMPLSMPVHMRGDVNAR